MRRPVLVLAALAALALTACSSSSPGSTSSPAPAPTQSASPSSTVSSTVAPPSSSSAVRTSSAAHTSTPPTKAPTTHRTHSTPPPATATLPGGTFPKGTVVVLNPGHNGGNASHTAEINRQVPSGYGQYKACDTTGTSTDAGYPEHAFTWDVANRVRVLLQSRGVQVVMTRSSDTGVGPCVNDRAAIGNHSNVAAVVSIHADGAPSSGHGFHVNQDSRTPDGATLAIANASKALGRDIHATLESSSGLVPSTYIGSDGYFYRSDLAGLNLATRPATFLELGNMRNSGDAALLSSASGRQRIAAAVAAGILTFIGR